MKKYKIFLTRILLLIMIVNVLMFCVSCGNNSNDNKTISEEKAIEIVDKLRESSAFESNLVSVSENVIISSYKIPQEKVSHEDNESGSEAGKKQKIEVLAAYMGDGASAEEIVVLKGNKNDIKEITEEYLKSKSESYRDYLPLEADKVDNATLEQYGDISIICISKDSKLAKSIIGN